MKITIEIAEADMPVVTYAIAKYCEVHGIVLKDTSDESLLAATTHVLLERIKELTKVFVVEDAVSLATKNATDSLKDTDLFKQEPIKDAVAETEISGIIV